MDPNIMHPKTFHVIIRHPFDLLVPNGLSMYVHGDTWQNVLDWVESTFPGVDTRPTVFRKSAASGSVPRIGNRDPVVINDVDLFCLTKRVGGKLFRSKAPEGHWRHSTEQVLNDLFNVAAFLREHSTSLTRSFFRLRHQYECGSEQALDYDRLLKLKAVIERAEVWHDNVLRQCRRLDMPEPRPAAGQLAASNEGLADAH